MDQSVVDHYPTVSVIVPNYNHAKYLDLRIQSILSQTYSDFELIFLDDASTDNSLEIIEKYTSDNRVRCILNKENSGSTFIQWNRGAKAARGKYFWIAESDDFSEPDFLEKTVPLLEENSSLGLVYAQSILIDKEGHELGLAFEGIWRSDPKRWLSSFTNNGLNEIRNYLGFENTIPNASAVLIRKTMFDQVGGAKENLRLHGDYVLWIDLLLDSDIAFVANPLNHFRFSMSSVRYKLRTYGYDIEERYRITKYMFQKIDFDPRVKDRICFNLVRLWFHPKRIQTPLSRHIRIARIASEIDQHLFWNIVKRFVTGPFKLLYMETIGHASRKKMLYHSLRGKQP
jgi:glycosyltransferase involved in cell wall biosynthesis